MKSIGGVLRFIFRHLVPIALLTVLLIGLISYRPAAPTPLPYDAAAVAQYETWTEIQRGGELHRIKAFYLFKRPADGSPSMASPMVETFQRALPLAQFGYPAAQAFLAELFDAGHGIDKDSCSALEWDDKAARQGDPDAQARLAHDYSSLESRGVEPDPVLACLWARAAAKGDAVYSYADEWNCQHLSEDDRQRLAELESGWRAENQPPAVIHRYAYMSIISFYWVKLRLHVRPCRE